MREIKFIARCSGKNCECNDWHYLEFPSDTEEWFGDTDPKTWCEYTGIKDKNGEEIYEGHKIKTFTMGGGKWTEDDGISVIKFMRAGFSRVREYEDCTFNLPLWWLDQDSQQFEIVGHIYEPEEVKDE